MNTIDLLDKLDLPVKIGLEGSNALFNRMTIMDAYLSAASLHCTKQKMHSESSFSWNYSRETSDFLFSQPQPLDAGRTAPFDLFKMVGKDSVAVGQDTEDGSSRVALDLLKLKDLGQFNLDEQRQLKGKCQDDSKGPDQNETESESYTKLELETKMEQTSKSKKTGKKISKSDINQLIMDERRRLLKKLDSCETDRIVFKRRIKNSQKDPAMSADTYRGSRYWGVSKNKSKWQVIEI